MGAELPMTAWEQPRPNPPSVMDQFSFRVSPEPLFPERWRSPRQGECCCHPVQFRGGSGQRDCAGARKECRGQISEGKEWGTQRGGICVSGLWLVSQLSNEILM